MTTPITPEQLAADRRLWKHQWIRYRLAQVESERLAVIDEIREDFGERVPAYIAAVESRGAEIQKLLNAIGEHVTMRSEYCEQLAARDAEIERLRSLAARAAEFVLHRERRIPDDLRAQLKREFESNG